MKPGLLLMGTHPLLPDLDVGCDLDRVDGDVLLQAGMAYVVVTNDDAGN